MCIYRSNQICMRHCANQLFNYTLWFESVFCARFVSALFCQYFYFTSRAIPAPTTANNRRQRRRRRRLQRGRRQRIIYLIISSSFGYVNFINYIAQHRELLTGMKSRDDCFKNTCWFIWSVFIFSFVFTWIRWLVGRSVGGFFLPCFFLFSLRFVAAECWIVCAAHKNASI